MSSMMSSLMERIRRGDYWLFVFGFVCFLNLGIMLFEQNHHYPENRPLVALLRLGAAIFFAILFAIGCFSNQSIKSYLAGAGVLTMSCLMSYFETLAQTKTYYNGLFMILFCIGFGELGFFHALIIFLIPISTYRLLAGPAYFDRIWFELFLFTFLSFSVSRFLAYYRIRSKGAEVLTWTSGIFHEMKSELYYISFAAQALLESDLQETRVHAQTIAREAQVVLDMQELWFNYLKYNSLTSGDQSLSALLSIKNSVDSYPYKNEDEKKAVFCKQADDFTFIGDPLLMKMIINNLLQNALRLNSHKITISISTEKRTITVKSEGVGIPAYLRKRIFAPGFSTRKDAAAGYGLTFCRAAMKKMGGIIVCQSDGKTHASFILTFPKEAK